MLPLQFLLPSQLLLFRLFQKSSTNLLFIITFSFLVLLGLQSVSFHFMFSCGVFKNERAIRYIGQIPDSVDDTLIQSVLSQCGKVRRCTILFVYFSLCLRYSNGKECKTRKRRNGKISVFYPLCNKVEVFLGKSFLRIFCGSCCALLFTTVSKIVYRWQEINC